MLEAKFNDAIDLLQKGEIDSLLEKINNVLKSKPELKWKLMFATLYLDCAEFLMVNRHKIEESDLLITKALQLYKKHENNAENTLFFNLNKARAYGLRYDIIYMKNQIEIYNYNTIDYTNLKSIYDIEYYLTDCIKLYRDSLKEVNLDEEERYNIRNNLAQHLASAGRFIESLELFEINMKNELKRWQSFASYGDILHTFAKVSLLPSTISLHLNICESYLNAQKSDPHLKGSNSIAINMDHHVKVLKSYNCHLTDEVIKTNRKEEAEEFQSLNQYRKFVLSNSLSLNEHSLYCKCKDAKIDNLKIGTLSGSVHVHDNNKIEILDGFANRILSEFCYSWFLYFNHISGISTNPNDVEFSNISIQNDDVGYKVEQIRSSYRLIWWCT